MKLESLDTENLPASGVDFWKSAWSPAQSCASALHGDSEGAKRQISSPNADGQSKHKLAKSWIMLDSSNCIVPVLTLPGATTTVEPLVHPEQITEKVWHKRASIGILGPIFSRTERMSSMVKHFHGTGLSKLNWFFFCLQPSSKMSNTSRWRNRLRGTFHRARRRLGTSLKSWHSTAQQVEQTVEVLVPMTRRKPCTFQELWLKLVTCKQEVLN